MPYTAFLITLCLVLSPLFSSVLNITNFKEYEFSKKNFSYNDALQLKILKDNSQKPIFSHQFLEDEIARYQDNNIAVKWGKGISGLAPHFFGIDSQFQLPDWKSFLTDSRISSFSISFYFFPKTISEESLIEGEQMELGDNIVPVSFRVGLNNGLIRWEMKNFFKLNEKRFSKTLVSHLPFRLKNWNHVVLQYDERNARLLMFLNGEMVDYTYATLNGKRSGPIYTMGFTPNHSTPDNEIVIGKRFNGIIDEIELFDGYSRIVSSRFKIFDHTPTQGYRSILTSRIFRLGKNSQLEKVNLTGENIDLKRAKFFMCNDKNFFTERVNYSDCNQIFWNKQLADYPSAEFYQFFLVYDNLDQVSKSIDSLTLTYQEELHPLPPRWIGLQQTKDGMLLEWKQTLENINGYRIYYRKNDFKGEKSIIELTTDQLEIYQTLEQQWNYILEGLEKDQLYFFGIKTFDYVNGEIRESSFSSIKNFYYSSDFFN